ncbi:hypothetical protein T069G_09815 [Trichoderma breve]|uniref:carnosine N-methyltransferase n=1 Tax=Trichoderma breve TaxID=2034170 RepID=A0A9W9E4M5_9HYPO|nr:hypothetical protein T069G_09815 [Trichoderma breve]KAJ4856447.1 hypothetical protein T069G_09815 [Trichoderma breve]
MDHDGGATLAVAEESAWASVDGGMDDPEEIRVIFCALDSFAQYAKVAHFNVTHLRRRSFYALPQAHWKLLAAPPFNFLDTLDKVDEAIDTNAVLARAILKSGLTSFNALPPSASESDPPVMPHEWAGIAKHADIDKARSTLRQFYRDWTEAGAEERAASYGPVMKALEKETKASEGRRLKVLVPGAGLGRLVFELYAVPDIHPGTTLLNAPNLGSMSMCAADFLCLYGDEDHEASYDAVASVFFLDTAPNLIRYLEVIYHCLRPGGVLINVGPLLWHFENNAPGNHGHDDDGDGEHDFNNSSGIADPGSFELSNDEVMALVEKLGFVVESMEMGLRAPYIQDTDSMLQTVYNVTTWVARKPLEKKGTSDVKKTDET